MSMHRTASRSRQRGLSFFGLIFVGLFAVADFAIGEGYHNYHHTFPWDYSTSELGFRSDINFTTMFIDFFEYCGLAYDLRKPTQAMIEARTDKLGDGSYDKVEVKRRRVGLKGLLILVAYLTCPFLVVAPIWILWCAISS